MNKKNPYKFFNSRQDHLKWDNYVKQVDEIELSDNERQDIKQAINYLRSLLGEDFLEKAFTDYHPIYFNYFVNSAPWVRLSLLRFVNTLKSFENSPDFNNLVSRIKKADRFTETRSVLEFAYKFHRAGFILTFDQNVEVINKWGNKNNKIPDIKLINPENNEEIYVEVTQIGASQKQILTSKTYDAIWYLLRNAMYSNEGLSNNFQNQSFYLPFSRIHRSIDENEIIDVVNQINQVVEKVKNTGEFQELIIEGIFELAIAPPHKHIQAEEWAKARNISDMVKSPSIPLDGIRRTKGKIFKKMKQLPTDKPGIVAIHLVDNLTLWAYGPGNIMVEVEEEVEKHSHLMFAAILQTYIDGENDSELGVLKNHISMKRKRSDQVTEQLIIVNNKTCKIAVSDLSQNKLAEALLQF
jgi:hypothetical protein